MHVHVVVYADVVPAAVVQCRNIPDRAMTPLIDMCAHLLYLLARAFQDVRPQRPHTLIHSYARLLPYGALDSTFLHMCLPMTLVRPNTEANGPILESFTLTTGDAVIDSARCERCPIIEVQMCQM